jgi:DNA mismatch repair protein MutS
VTSPPRPTDTPVIRQYREIKAQHPKAILFFRMGDFYEMFFDDAELASRELGLTLTSRNNGAAADVPLAGVPVKAASEYVRRLVERGHRVAICEQIEDPKTAKGIVRRAVVETITPGAILADTLLDGSRDNFLLAVQSAGDRVGLAALEISTGEFVLETVPIEDLGPAVDQYAPREIVYPAGAEPTLATAVMMTPRDPWEFDALMATEDITKRFDLASLDGLGIDSGDQLALGAAAAVLRYASELQPGGLPHIVRPRVKRSGTTMPIDEMTRRNLELVEPLHEASRGTTVFDLLNSTKTPMGARTLRRWLLAPLREVDAIGRRHAAVETLALDSRGRPRLRDALNGVRDVERLAGRAAARRASPRDLGALRDSLQRLPDVLGALDGLANREHSADLDRVAETFDLAADLCAELTRMLVDRPPMAIGDADSIRPGADGAVDEARDLRDGGKSTIGAMQATEREATGIPSLKIGYNKVFGYYIEVTKTHRKAVPERYERRQTLTNAERYVTPELKEYEARVLGAEEDLLARERELIDHLCGLVETHLDRVQSTARLLGRLDVYASFAEIAATANYVRPVMTEEMGLSLTACRHPVVERMLPHGKFIPNDVHLDDAQRVMLLTGPNMAGKSTALRQVGLSVLLAQVGSFVPASAATIGVVDRVFTRVGASDNLNRGQSTFMVEMSETSSILHNATSRSLILLDEIGRGTSTYDGVAIAWGVTEHIHDRIGAKTIFATHYHELTQLTEELQHACNFNVAVREIGDDIVFLHTLVPGGADRSYGIHVARLAGLPERVVTRAHEILKLLESGHHVAGKPVPAEPDPNQLGLFETVHPVVEELRLIDTDTITPLQALSMLADLKRRAQGDGT